MANKGMTDKDIFGLIMDKMADNAEVVAFCERHIAQLNKKSNTASREFRANLIDILQEADTAMTSKEIAELMNVTPQKVTNNIKYLVWDGVIVRVEGENSKAASRYALSPEVE